MNKGNTMLNMDRTLAELAPLPDEDILARVVDGDIAAFELLMRRHNTRLYRVARAVMHDDLEAEDIVQEAYVRAYAHLNRFEGRASVATWLTRIAFHEALRRRRRRAREATVQRSRARHREITAGTFEVAEMAVDPQTRSSLALTLDALPVSTRAVVVLRLVQGLSTRETASCLRLSEANVKVLLHRGTRALRDTMGAEPVDSLREQYAFGAERCDRVVAAVLQRLARP
ncbi:MAG: sigma-70 family RNA polymerase sigma factor [Phycisphaerales bacterium]|nr:sigma-70 family RNA polymerase sigma factor [Phycisphaerales bacterium]